TTVAVFLPMVFVEGVAGQLFRDQALTVTIALLISLVVSLTLIPMLASIKAEAPLGFAQEPGDGVPAWRKAWRFALAVLAWPLGGRPRGALAIALFVVTLPPWLVLFVLCRPVVALAALLPWLVFAATWLGTLLGRAGTRAGGATLGVGSGVLMRGYDAT